ncbi:hypothetical protein GJ496_008039 [Pomphorhynchus laevis]|nr:hypothetical protein GJ496_008039 [Pomphorhynchus laevis]
MSKLMEKRVDHATLGNIHVKRNRRFVNKRRWQSFQKHDISNVVNISGKDISNSHSETLSLGIKFIPTSQEFNRLELIQSLQNTVRGIFAETDENTEYRSSSIGKMTMKNDLSLNNYIQLKPNTGIGHTRKELVTKSDYCKDNNITNNNDEDSNIESPKIHKSSEFSFNTTFKYTPVIRDMQKNIDKAFTRVELSKGKGLRRPRICSKNNRNIRAML